MKNFMVLLGSLLVLISCSGNKEDKSTGDLRNSFYTKASGWDYERIPLIRPYEIKKLNHDNGWILSLKERKTQLSISNIKKVNVVDSIIILLARETYLKGEEVPEAWFVIVPHKKLELGFPTLELLLAYLKERAFSDNFKLVDIDSVYSSLQKKWPIEWEKDF